MEKSVPVLSITLPFYNAAKSLEAAMESISTQSFKDFECILVDNNSSDGGMDVARKHCQKDPRFKLVQEERQGVMHASNRGAAQGRGKYIARMDADDVALPDRFRLQVEFLDEHPDYGAVAGLVRHVGDPESTGGFQRFVDWSNSVMSYKEILNSRFIEAPIVNPTAMWRREVQEEHGLYLEGDFPEDYEMWLRWLDRGVKMAKVPELVLEWHDSNSRLTRTHPIYSDQAFYRIKSHYLATWLAAHNPFHPEVWVWGASRISRRRARVLEDQGVHISAYIDTKHSRQLDRDVIYYEDLPGAGTAFILSYIRQMDNRDRIRSFLESRNYTEGKDYLLIS